MLQRENKVEKLYLTLTSSNKIEMRKMMKSYNKAEIQYTKTEVPLKNWICFALEILSVTVRRQNPLIIIAMPSCIFEATTFPFSNLQNKEQKKIHKKSKR